MYVCLRSQLMRKEEAEIASFALTAAPVKVASRRAVALLQVCLDGPGDGLALEIAGLLASGWTSGADANALCRLSGAFSSLR